MPPEQKAAWIRRVFVLALIGTAAAAGYFFVMPKGGPNSKKKPSSLVKVTKENIKEVQGKPGVLTVTNMRLDGNPNSEKLQEILEQLKQDKYGEKVQMAEVDIVKEKEIATSAGLVDLNQFAGQLDFHAEGKKLGDLVGETNPTVVEATIDRYLAGLLQRIDKNWLPQVPGMQKIKGQPVLEAKPSKKHVSTTR